MSRDWLVKENDTFIKICDRTIIENACAVFEYRKENDYSRMIHKLKFSYDKKALFDLGSFIGNKLYDETHWLADIDLIIPVPLHKFRKLKRGYNQSEEFSRGLNETFGKEIDSTSIIRSKYRKAQVKTSSFEERWTNAENLFSVVDKENLEGKHILIVDDVITTGATVISLIEAIKESVSDVKIYVLALSSTKKVVKTIATGTEY